MRPWSAAISRRAEGVWQEPIYRDVWGLVREFGDAELAGLIAPRALIVEASRGPEVTGPPPETKDTKTGACPNGRLTSPPLDSVREEVERARPFFAGLGAEQKLQLVVSGRSARPARLRRGASGLLTFLGCAADCGRSGNPLPEARPNYRSRTAAAPPVRSTGGLHSSADTEVSRSARGVLVESG